MKGQHHQRREGDASTVPQLTKTKGGFANENSVLKLLYAGIMRASDRAMDAPGAELEPDAVTASDKLRGQSQRSR